MPLTGFSHNFFLNISASTLRLKLTMIIAAMLTGLRACNSSVSDDAMVIFSSSNIY